MTRQTASFLIVTKPTGEVLKRPINLKFDDSSGLIEVLFIGESQLKGYEFAILETEVERVKVYGELV